MVDYFVLIFVVLFSGVLANLLGFNPAWILVPVIVLTLPTVYTTFSGTPFLPTDKNTMKRMMELAEIKPGEIVVDLGCGDGRLLRESVAKGAMAIGYEISVYLYLIARWKGDGEVRFQSFWQADLSQADVIFAFVGPRAMARFERDFWHQLKPGCRVIAHAFSLPHIKPTKTDQHVYRYDKA